MKAGQVLEKKCLQRRVLLACPFFINNFILPMDLTFLIILFTMCITLFPLMLARIRLALDLEMLDKAKLDKQIENFPWTGEFNDGGF